ncbi:uncharacterized membrane protein YsdA (DUF1294 family) [Sphingopyxis panaciterrae]|uniref:DUF1294 domain-containing protein n=1 Tax=Sphingopyxis panaciterrae TaxID=363841 RepID=UPI001421A686|nr:DUF1294 domain-containing protein [Sphingopyxis panaciterrae]NIJ36228.1 uncharacterized membrane protein YsdA (DUF1294 family) [Sphingopyxis panaciterrae]
MTEYLLIWLGVANGIAFGLMVADKRRAEASARRISESTLLGWSWLGGAIGTYLASRLVRHKTRKQPFANKMVMLCAAEIVLLGLWGLDLIDPIVAAALAYLPRPA